MGAVAPALHPHQKPNHFAAAAPHMPTDAGQEIARQADHTLCSRTKLDSHSFASAHRLLAVPEGGAVGFPIRMASRTWPVSTRWRSFVAWRRSTPLLMAASCEMMKYSLQLGLSDLVSPIWDHLRVGHVTSCSSWRWPQCGARLRRLGHRSYLSGGWGKGLGRCHGRPGSARTRWHKDVAECNVLRTTAW